MKLKLMIPERVLLESQAAKIVARCPDGYFCLLPRHADYVSMLAPGLLSLEDEQGRLVLAAVDQGTLVKSGDEVLVSTRHAILGDDPEELRRIVAENYMSPGEDESDAREVVAGWAEEFLPTFVRTGGK